MFEPELRNAKLKVRKELRESFRYGSIFDWDFSMQFEIN